MTELTDTDHQKQKKYPARGMASANQATRLRVATAGGEAIHPPGKRGLQNCTPEERRRIAELGGKARGKQKARESKKLGQRNGPKQKAP